MVSTDNMSRNKNFTSAQVEAAKTFVPNRQSQVYTRKGSKRELKISNILQVGKTQTSNQLNKLQVRGDTAMQNFVWRFFF